MQQVQAVIDAGLVPLVVHHLSKVRSALLGGGGGWGEPEHSGSIGRAFDWGLKGCWFEPHGA